MKFPGIISSALCTVFLLHGAVAVAESQQEAPVVGGAVMAINVDVVATTGYRASKIIGSDIYNGNGEKVGLIDEFIVASDAKVSVAVISVGGFLGLGSRLVAVPASMIERNNQGQFVLPGATKDKLIALPEFIYAK